MEYYIDTISAYYN